MPAYIGVSQQHFEALLIAPLKASVVTRRMHMSVLLTESVHLDQMVNDRTFCFLEL